ncbi:MAG: hypothetical protein WCE79_03555, partial [Xanthobacteraceae bacterium]
MIWSPYRNAISHARRTPKPTQDDPFDAQRPAGSRRPHTDGKVAQVRRLVETTLFTYAEISARTGVAPASICRWTAAGK